MSNRQVSVLAGIAALVLGAALLIFVGPMVGLLGPGDALGITYLPAMLVYLAALILVIGGIALLARAGAHRRSTPA